MPNIKRGRKKKTKTYDSSTQTEAVMGVDTLRVCLRRIVCNENSNLTIQHPSVAQTNRETVVLRAPSSYTNFAKPITNNEKANSTISATRIETNLYRGDKTFIKPGPLCYKKRVLQKQSESLLTEDNMIARNAVDDEDEDERPIELEPIIEQAEDTIDIDLHPESDEDNEQINNNRRSTTVKTVRFKNTANGDNILITSSGGYQQKNNDCSSSGSSHDDESNDEQPRDRRAKYVRIKADHVYIHNHFYKSC